MKKRYLAILAAAAIAASVSLTACGGAEGGTEPSQSETEEVSSVIRADESSSAAASEASVQDDSAPTKDGFEKTFSENPLDAAYNKQMDTLTTNQDMISATETFAGLWNDEINHAYEQLMKVVSDDEKKELEARREKWQDELDSRLQDIAESVTGDGSALRLERAMRVKDFYRTEAMDLYEQLYEYNKDFTYLYAPY